MLKTKPMVFSIRNMAVPLIMLGVFASTSCDRRPEGVLSEKETVDLITDMQIAQAYYSTAGPSAGKIDRRELFESVLSKHGVTHQQLDSTIAYYGRNMDEYYLLYEKVEKNLRTKNGQLEESLNEDDIWPFSRFAAFLPGQSSDGITFSIPAEDITPGNTLDWRMRLTSPEGVEILLGVEYEEGGASLVKKNAAGNRSLQIKLLTDTARTPRRVFGSMTVPQSFLPLWADSIRLVRSDFDSLEYYRIHQQKLISSPSRRPMPTLDPDTSNALNL